MNRVAIVFASASIELSRELFLTSSRCFSAKIWSGWAKMLRQKSGAAMALLDCFVCSSTLLCACPPNISPSFAAMPKYALRMLAKSPGFAAVGIVSLAIGIGVCGYFFSTSSAFMFHPLAGARDRATLAGLDTPVPYTYFERYREQAGVATATAFTDPVPFSVGREGVKDIHSERLFGVLVSSEYFTVLGMLPEQGRFFSAASARTGTAPVVVRQRALLAFASELRPTSHWPAFARQWSPAYGRGSRAGEFSRCVAHRRGGPVRAGDIWRQPSHRNWPPTQNRRPAAW